VKANAKAGVQSLAVLLRKEKFLIIQFTFGRIMMNQNLKKNNIRFETYFLKTFSYFFQKTRGKNYHRNLSKPEKMSCISPFYFCYVNVEQQQPERHL
jgi:hypothetical protein